MGLGVARGGSPGLGSIDTVLCARSAELEVEIMKIPSVSKL